MEKNLEESQTEEQSQGKSDNSYRYWVHSDPNGQAPLPAKVPQPVEGSASISEPEERIVEISTVKQAIEASLKESHVIGPDGRIEFYNVSKVEGEFTLVVVRGKVKPGFALKINMKYRGLGEYKGAKGLFKFTSFTDDGDRDFSVEGAGDVAKEECKKLANQCSKLLGDRLLSILKAVV